MIIEKAPFKPSDALCKPYLLFLEETVKIFGGEVEAAGFSPLDVTVEAFGTFNRTRSWTTESGYYVTYRPKADLAWDERMTHALTRARNRWLASHPNLTPPDIDFEDPTDPSTSVTLAITTHIITCDTDDTSVYGC